MPGSRSLFFPWGQASAVAIYGALGNGSCFPLSGWARRAQAFWPDRAFASVGRKPPTTAAFLVGPDAAGVGVLAGPRARLRRADGARPSSFPPPLARPLFSFLDVERPFLPLSRSFFSALGELFSSFFNTKWRSVDFHYLLAR